LAEAQGALPAGAFDSEGHHPKSIKSEMWRLDIEVVPLEAWDGSTLARNPSVGAANGMAQHEHFAYYCVFAMPPTNA